MGEFDAKGIGIQDRFDNLAGLDCRLSDQQNHGCQLPGIRSANAVVPLALPDLLGKNVDEDLLTGTQPVGNVDHRQFRRRAQDRADKFIASQPARHRGDPLH
jgi:hypothetical protein